MSNFIEEHNKKVSKENKKIEKELKKQSDKNRKEYIEKRKEQLIALVDRIANVYPFVKDGYLNKDGIDIFKKSDGDIFGKIDDMYFKYKRNFRCVSKLGIPTLENVLIFNDEPKIVCEEESDNKNRKEAKLVSNISVVILGNKRKCRIYEVDKSFCHVSIGAESKKEESKEEYLQRKMPDLNKEKERLFFNKIEEEIKKYNQTNKRK